MPTSPHSPPRPWSVPPALLSIFVLHTGLYMLAPLCFPNIYVNIHLCSAVSSQPEPRCLFSPKKSPEKQKPQTRPSGSTQISPSSHDRKQAQNEALRWKWTHSFHYHWALFLTKWSSLWSSIVTLKCSCLLVKMIFFNSWVWDSSRSSLVCMFMCNIDTPGWTGWLQTD